MSEITLPHCVLSSAAVIRCHRCKNDGGTKSQEDGGKLGGKPNNYQSRKVSRLRWERTPRQIPSDEERDSGFWNFAIQVDLKS